jgi:hypothetical protein
MTNRIAVIGVASGRPSPRARRLARASPTDG